MSGFRSILVTVLVGAVLGAIFMFAALGYFGDNKPGPIHGSDDSMAVAASSTSASDSFSHNDILDQTNDTIHSTRKNAIVRAAEKLGPAVVSLSVIQVVQSGNSSPFGSDFWDFLFLPPPRRERSVLSLGSGVIINPQGYVLTNHHVVEDAKEIRVTLVNGDEYPGALVGSDPVTDLAVVRIFADSGTVFPNAVLGDSDDLIIGEWAIAIGNPFGYLLDDPKPTVTVGVISATNRDIKPEAGQVATYRKMIQTDAAINPGNSGGPLVNALGEVIGINTFIFSSSHGSEGVGFAVPINRAKLVINDILKYGEVVKAWIGVHLQPIDPAIATNLGLKMTKGVVITAVGKNSPASKAGLKAGDVPLTVGDIKIHSDADWEEIESYARAGRPLGVKILRADKEIPLVIIPEEIPTRQAPNKTDKFGLKVASLTPAVASYIGISDTEGVLVIGTSETSWAERWRLREGDIIRQIGKHKVLNLDDYIETMDSIGKGYKIVFMIERGGDIYFIQALT